MHFPTRPRWIEINANRKKCRKIARILRQKNPELKLPIHNNTIVPYRKNSKYEKEGNARPSRRMVAHCHPSRSFQPDRKPRICIKQYFLYWPLIFPTHKNYGSGRVTDKLIQPYHWLDGNFALIDIMCHELAHFTTLGHGEEFLKVFQRYLSQIAGSIISGEFYRWFLK